MNERRSGSLGRILQWYVVRELVFPTTIALAGLTVLVLTRDLLGLSDLIINRGFGATTVAWIAFSKVVPLAAHILPFAVLIGVLVGIGRLRADREVLAMEAAGVSSRRLLGPVLTFTALITAVGLQGPLSLIAFPWSFGWRSLERQSLWGIRSRRAHEMSKVDVRASPGKKAIPYAFDGKSGGLGEGSHGHAIMGMIETRHTIREFCLADVILGPARS